MKYIVVYEKEGKSYGAYVPDLPGRVAVARTLPRGKKLIREAIALHVEDLLERGERLPKPVTEIEYVEAQPA
jgi:predicted RNase H-like HicB family nuclease